MYVHVCFWAGILWTDELQRISIINMVMYELTNSELILSL